MFNADEINEHLSNKEEDEPEPIGPWAQAAQEDKRVALAIEPFAHAFGVVHGDAMQFVADITRDALVRFRHYEIKRSQITIAKYRNSRSIIGYAKSLCRISNDLDENSCARSLFRCGSIA